MLLRVAEAGSNRLLNQVREGGRRMSKVLMPAALTSLIIASTGAAQAPSPNPAPSDPIARFAAAENLTPTQESALRKLITEEKQKKIASSSDRHAVLQDARKRAATILDKNQMRDFSLVDWVLILPHPAADDVAAKSFQRIYDEHQKKREKTTP
jgi:hypothetical protein